MELPKCASFRNGDCPRSDVKILREGDDFWLIGCMTCKSSRVLSKPIAVARARNESETARIPRATERELRVFMSHTKKVNLQQGYILKG